MYRERSKYPDYYTTNNAQTATAVTTNSSVSPSTYGPLSSPFLPQLAQLRWLQELHIKQKHGRYPDGTPAAWLRPGAFPSLQL